MQSGRGMKRFDSGVDKEMTTVVQEECSGGAKRRSARGMHGEHGA